MSQPRLLVACPYCSRRHSREYVCEAEYEGWIDSELQEKQDYAGLVAHCEAVVEWKAAGPHFLPQLGSAYVLNGEPEKAIELLSGPHRENPWWADLQSVILNALFAQGKDETCFDWVERMPVYRLGASVLDRCHEILKPWSDYCTAGDLYTEIPYDGYCVFTPEELLAALRSDERFVVGGGVPSDPRIRARGKREEEVGSLKSSRNGRMPAGGPVKTAVTAELPTIPEPEEDDPELGRTRLYPMWGDQKFYGESQSREEERRQELECLNIEHYRQQGDIQSEIATMPAYSPVGRAISPCSTISVVPFWKTASRKRSSK